MYGKGWADMSDSLRRLKSFYNEILNCTNCPLYKSRKQVVTGEGGYSLPIVLIGEAPGRVEDELGRPFSGRAGKMLDFVMKRVGLTREDIFIINAVKCRPPMNRKPYKLEILRCSEYLKKEIEILKPKLIVTLGITSLQGLSFIGSMISEKNRLTYSNIRLKDLRGRLITLSINSDTYYVFPTLHPAVCLRNPLLTKELEKDLTEAINLIKSNKIDQRPASEMTE